MSAYYYVVRQGDRVVWKRLATTYAEAISLWAKLEGTSTVVGEKVADAVDRYAREILPGLAEKTRDDYALSLAKLRHAFGDGPLAEVRPVHVAQYLDAATAKVSANRDVAVLSSVFAYAMRWGWCDHNACRGVRRHSERPRDRYITDEELARLRAAADLQWQCIIDLAYATALRRGDLMALRLADIGPEGLSVVQQKTKAKLLYTMTPELRAILDRARRLHRRVGTLLLFATRTGQAYSESGWESSWRRIREKAGVKDVHFHDIRHRAITDAKQRFGIEHAQALAGHASVTMTEAYVTALKVVRVTPLK
jgi:integrase